MRIRDLAKQLVNTGLTHAKTSAEAEGRAFLGNKLDKLAVRIKTGQSPEGDNSTAGSGKVMARRIALNSLSSASQHLQTVAATLPQPSEVESSSLRNRAKLRITPFVLQQTAHVLDHAAGRIENPDPGRPSNLESFAASAQAQLHEWAHQAREQAQPVAMNLAAQGMQHLSDGFGAAAAKLTQAQGPANPGESAETPQPSPSVPR